MAPKKTTAAKAAQSPSTICRRQTRFGPRLSEQGFPILVSRDGITKSKQGPHAITLKDFGFSEAEIVETLAHMNQMSRSELSEKADYVVHIFCTAMGMTIPEPCLTPDAEISASDTVATASKEATPTTVTSENCLDSEVTVVFSKTSDSAAAENAIMAVAPCAENETASTPKFQIPNLNNNPSEEGSIQASGAHSLNTIFPVANTPAEGETSTISTKTEGAKPGRPKRKRKPTAKAIQNKRLRLSSPLGREAGTPIQKAQTVETGDTAGTLGFAQPTDAKTQKDSEDSTHKSDNEAVSNVNREVEDDITMVDAGTELDGKFSTAAQVAEAPEKPPAVCSDAAEHVDGGNRPTDSTKVVSISQNVTDTNSAQPELQPIEARFFGVTLDPNPLERVSPGHISGNPQPAVILTAAVPAPARATRRTQVYMPQGDTTGMLEKVNMGGSHKFINNTLGASTTSIVSASPTIIQPAQIAKERLSHGPPPAQPNMPYKNFTNKFSLKPTPTGGEKVAPKPEKNKAVEKKKDEVVNAAKSEVSKPRRRGRPPKVKSGDDGEPAKLVAIQPKPILGCVPVPPTPGPVTLLPLVTPPLAHTAEYGPNTPQNIPCFAPGLTPGLSTTFPLNSDPPAPAGSNHIADSTPGHIFSTGSPTTLAPNYENPGDARVNPASLPPIGSPMPDVNILVNNQAGSKVLATTTRKRGRPPKSATRLQSATPAPLVTNLAASGKSSLLTTNGNQKQTQTQSPHATIALSDILNPQYTTGPITKPNNPTLSKETEETEPLVSADTTERSSLSDVDDQEDGDFVFGGRFAPGQRKRVTLPSLNTLQQTARKSTTATGNRIGKSKKPQEKEVEKGQTIIQSYFLKPLPIPILPTEPSVFGHPNDGDLGSKNLQTNERRASAPVTSTNSANGGLVLNLAAPDASPVVPRKRGRPPGSGKKNKILNKENEKATDQKVAAP